ncbi:unnamed protein product [Cochlearia groenlandica]
MNRLCLVSSKNAHSLSWSVDELAETGQHAPSLIVSWQESRHHAQPYGEGIFDQSLVPSFLLGSQVFFWMSLAPNALAPNTSCPFLVVHTISF